MFSSSVAPSALNQHIARLEADIRERKREVLKQQQVTKCLQEECQRKDDAVRVIQDKTRQLDDAIKQTHEVYLNQKDILERVKESVDVLNQQCEMKAKELEKTKQENSKFRSSSEEYLRRYQEKFEKYMEVYRTFPGVVEYEQMRDRLNAAQSERKDLAEKVSETEAEVAELEERKQKRKAALDNLKFKSITAWGVALAKKYMEYVEEQTSEKEFELEVEDRKARISKLEQQVEDQKKAKTKMEEQEWQKTESGAVVRMHSGSGTPTTTTVKARSYGDFSKLSVTYKDFLKVGSKFRASSLRTSVPNLSTKSFDLAKKFKFNVLGPSSTTHLLSRSKSVNELARGASGAAVDRDLSVSGLSTVKPAAKSLQKWLTSARVQTEKLKSKVVPTGCGLEERSVTAIPTPKFEEPSSMDESIGSLDTLSCFQDCKETLTRGAEADEPFNLHNEPLVITTAKSPGFFSFPAMCKSPEDNFKFMARAPTQPLKKGRGKGDKSEEGSVAFENANDSFNAFQLGFPSFPPTPDPTESGTGDFQFAVPSTLPPGRGVKVGTPKLHFSEFSSSESAAKQDSPFTFGNESFFGRDCNNGESGTSGFSFLGGSASQVSDEQKSGSNDFFSFGDNDVPAKTSDFGSLFHFGGP